MKCKNFFSRHRWSKWKVVKSEDVTRTKDGSVVGSYTKQERVCINCGFTEEYHKTNVNV